MHQAMTNIQANINWNHNTFRLLGRLVRDGLTDEQILANAAEFRCEGYTLTETIGELKGMITRARSKGYDQKRAPATAIVDEKRPSKSGPLLRRLSNITLEPVQFLVDDLLPEGSLSMLFGDPVCGKSFVAIDIAMVLQPAPAFASRLPKVRSSILRAKVSRSQRAGLGC